ncbi:MAG TPA: SNF2-related protein, partial [Ardenticatenaceae bacterium]
MGLGKRVQTIALLLRQREEGLFPQPVLIVCPTSVVANWAREVQRFGPGLRFLVHQGADRLRDEAFHEAITGVDLVLTSYPLVRRDEPFLKAVAWHGVILDEAQNIKNSTAKQTQVIRTLPASFRVALTGTPVENRLSELWSIMHFLNPGYLGSRHAFRQSYTLPIERYGDDRAREQLKRVVSPFILRRVKSDPRVIQDLPLKQEMKRYCSLSEEQATLYEAVVREALEEVEQAEEGMDRRGRVLSMLMQLEQICNHPALYLHQVGEGQLSAIADDARSGKLARLEEMLEEVLSVDERALIFTQFAEI